MSFTDFGLTPDLLKAIAEEGYTTPTPIQEQTIPQVLMGRDVLGCAQTGTGKTAAFTLPMIEVLTAGRARARMPRSLILSPTRELAMQTAEHFDRLGKYHKLNKALLIGGVNMDDQIRLLDRGVDVLIATPGRFLDHFTSGRILLTDIKILVIDEADRMLDMGFIPDVEKIIGLLPKIRQTLLFSATLSPEVRRIADAYLMNPKECFVAASASTADTVDQGLAVVPTDEKREALRRLIVSENVRNAIIFCNRKKDVDILYKSLKKHGLSVCGLHGDMTQSSRIDTLEGFKRGEKTILVASDVAARGLDIFDLSHVFNFDVPTHAEDYVHRIGRTGRAGRAGRAITLAAPDDAPYIDAIEKLIGKPIPRIEVPGMDALALDAVDGRRRGRGRGRSSSRPAARGGESHRAPKPRAEQPRREQPQRDDRPVVVQPAPVSVPSPAPVAASPAAPQLRDRDNLISMERRRPERKPEREHDEPVLGFGVGANVPAFMFAGRRAR